MHRHAWAWPVYKVHYKTHITSSTADRSGDWHTSRETVHGCILGKSTPKWLSLAMTCYYSMRCLPPSTTQANYVQNGWNWVALLSAMNIKGTTLLILTIGLQKQDRTVFVPLSKRVTLSNWFRLSVCPYFEQKVSFKEVRRPCMYISIHKQKVFCLVQCGTTF